MTDEPKPVNSRSAASSQCASCAVTISRLYFMPKASANVSSISVEPIFKGALPGDLS